MPQQEKSSSDPRLCEIGEELRCPSHNCSCRYAGFIPPPRWSWKTISDTTTKLFAIPVRCYPLGELVPVVGAWTNPYFETTIGLGFSGSCFEALTVIAHIGQSLSALVAPNGDQPAPTRDGLVNLLAKLCESYFNRHSGDGDPTLLLVAFGFDQGRPWVEKITWDKTKGVNHAQSGPRRTRWRHWPGRIVEQRASEWGTRIQKHRDSISTRNSLPTADGAFDRDLEV